MPRVVLPPTPAPSTDIQGKKKPRLRSLEMSFALPPPAIVSAGSNPSPSDSVNSVSESSYCPESPVSPAKNNDECPNDRAPSSQQPSSSTTTTEFSLPPPPTRSRKIIQMKPRAQQTSQSNGIAIPPSPRASVKRGGNGQAVANSPGGRKLPSTTSAAGRKVARKTAHSLIERRRRSKMNEEFGVLKDMIPACRDQEMHKLAILSASIDYLRYLEQCVTDLKVATRNMPTPQMTCQVSTARPTSPSPDNEDEDENDNHDQDSDLEMANTESTEPSSAMTSYTSNTPTFSPATNSNNRQNSTSTISSLPSPAFKPQLYQYQTYEPQYTHSTKTSPTITPNAMEDQEATAALMMLNQERRGIASSIGTSKRMSVKDLLSP